MSGAIEVDLACRRDRPPGRASDRTTSVSLRFGIPLHGKPHVVIEPTKVTIRPGQIVLVLGPSGSGKTSALAQFERQLRGGCAVQRVRFPADVAILDRVAPWASLSDAVAILTSCALSEPGLWVRPFTQLSDGERFRACLARAIGLQSRSATSTALLCDEFCSTLHRRAAKAISFNLRKLVERMRLTVVAACCNEDVITDLQPDTLVRLRGQGRCDVEKRDTRSRRPSSLRRNMRIERGGKRDYERFSAMHYRATDELGFVDKVFVMRERSSRETFGIVVYAFGPCELALRNRATAGQFQGNPRRLNESVRILRRLVIHPDVRGCGFGHYLVRKTLPLVGTEYVECLAAMGSFNPVFEKAGMRRIGRCAVPPKQRAALKRLQSLGVHPNDRDFTIHVCRSRRVREIVSGVVHAWYSATTGGGAARVARQPPQTLARIFRGLIASEPVYYLWHRRKQRLSENAKRNP